MHLFRTFLTVSVALMLAGPPAASAQEPEFAPAMLSLTGGDALTYQPSSALDVGGAGTVELWLQAGWTSHPGYDPAVLSHQGPNGARLAILVTGDAKALGVMAGPYYETVPFNFADGGLHHVALLLLGDQIAVMIDGEVRETLGFGPADLPVDRFDVGSLGGFSPFVGDIGQIRIWDEPLDPETLVDFAWRPIAAEGPQAHPDIDSLVATSAFANPETGGFVFMGPSEDANISVVDDEPIDDSELGLDDPELNSPA